MMREASVFFSAYAAWRSSAEATEKCPEAVPSSDATDEERGWFRALFKLPLHTPTTSTAMDKEWLLLLSVDHALLAAAQVLLSDEFGAEGTAPVEGDEQKRVVGEQSTPNAKLKAIVSSLGAFLGRFKIASGPAAYTSATCGVYRAKDNKAKISYERWFGDAAQGNTVGLSLFKTLCEQHNIADDENAAALLFKKHASEEQNAESLRGKKMESAISRDDFVKLCEATLGETRDVVIKFMSDHRTFRRELDSRSGKSFSPRFVINILESYEGADIREATTVSPKYARFANYAGARQNLAPA